MRSIFFVLSIATLALTSACSPSAPRAPAAIEWREGDVEEAFAEAAEAGKPVLLYWGAQWCPPCNRLKATLFQEPDFVAQTRDFVPVYLDGDSRGAQLWGEHFAIAGYPTLIILRADRSEITRLSGGGDADQIARALAAARESQTGVADLIARAQSEPQRLSAAEWTLVSEYGWEVDTNRIVAADQRAAVLQRLAAAAPEPAQARRFHLLALAAGGEEQTLTSARQAELRTLLDTVLTNAGEVRANRDALIYDGALLTSLLATDARAPVQSALIAALDGIYAQEDLPISDRLVAVYAEIAIHHANAGENAPAPPALLEKVRARAAWADAAAQTPYERQSAIYVAAGLLEDAGDLDGAERLLTAELERSATPFYYMPILAGIAEKRGDTAQALDWLRQGYETSVGPASRVQWGTLYVLGVTRLAPTDRAGVEQAATAVVDELANPDSYNQRTRARFARLETALNAWAAENNGADVLTRLRTRMQTVCPGQQSDAAARNACGAWLAATT